MQMPFAANYVPDANSAYELVKSLKLQKAMQTGDAARFAQNDPGNASALKPESLDKTMVNLSYGMDDIQFFRLLQRVPVDNSINQHNEMQSYAENPDASFFPEGGAPPQDSATFVRRLNQIKYMGVARGITHQLSVQNTINESALTIETQAGTMDLLGKIERMLWHADSSLSSLQFDGLFAQVRDKSPKSNTIDLHGKPMTEDVIVDAATMVRSDPNYGKLTHLFGSIAMKGDIARTFIPRTRMLAMQADADGKIGSNIRAVETPAGDLDLVGTTLMSRIGNMPLNAIGPAIGIPGTPTVSNVRTDAVPYSNFRDIDAGAYRAWVVAKNDVGSSAPVAVSPSAINISAGGTLTFDVTPAPGNPTKWYEVWRTPVNGAIGTQKAIFRQPNTDPQTTIAYNNTVTITEFNDEMPGTEKVAGLQMDADSLRLDVLAAMLRIPQPLVGTTIPFLLVSYLTLVLRAPRKVVVFKNVGRLPPQTPLL